MLWLLIYLIGPVGCALICIVITAHALAFHAVALHFACDVGDLRESWCNVIHLVHLLSYWNLGRGLQTDQILWIRFDAHAIPLQCSGMVQKADMLIRVQEAGAQDSLKQEA